MPHAGRPRRRTELNEIRKQIEAKREVVVSKVTQFFQERRNQDTKKERIARSRLEYAFIAARVLFTLEKGTPAQKRDCRRWIDRLRNTNYGAAVDPCRRVRHDADFLEAFIQKYAPGWDWRKETEDGSRAAREERVIQEQAQMLRDSRAHRNRHVVPERPDPSRLISLANRIKPNEPITWASLKELKLATSLSERMIRQFIKSNRPKKSELVLQTPKRFGPRLVLGVVEKFLERLPDMQMDQKERNACIAAARQLQKH